MHKALQSNKDTEYYVYKQLTFLKNNNNKIFYDNFCANMTPVVHYIHANALATVSAKKKIETLQVILRL